MVQQWDRDRRITLEERDRRQKQEENINWLSVSDGMENVWVKYIYSSKGIQVIVLYSSSFNSHYLLGGKYFASLHFSNCLPWRPHAASLPSQTDI